MKAINRYKGFSLAEVLISLGLFTIGMVFVASVFPVSIFYATKAAERTTAGVAAEEAFAKVRLYGIKFNSPQWTRGLPALAQDFNNIANTSIPDGSQLINLNDFGYPSNVIGYKQYYWSAICQAILPDKAQVTVFVCRKTGANQQYYYRDLNGNLLSNYTFPKPVWVDVQTVPGLRLDEFAVSYKDEINLINDGCTIMVDNTGELYRVLERHPTDNNGNTIIRLDRDYKGGLPSRVWVVPKPVGGGRNPCAAVYQKTIRF
jgi:type II secretory pathway pseudopilin PulG